jgi:hypothetical protein
MIFKSIVLAMILFFGVISVADAQSMFGDEKASWGELRSDGVITQAVPGWNFFHVAFCYADTSGFFVFGVETSIISFLFTTQPGFVSTLTPACQTGNLMGVFVTSVSGTNVSWSAIAMYPFK